MTTTTTTTTTTETKYRDIYHKQKETANADYVNNMKRQHITMYQHAQYVLAKNNTYTDMIQCVLPYARKSG